MVLHPCCKAMGCQAVESGASGLRLGRTAFSRRARGRAYTVGCTALHHRWVMQFKDLSDIISSSST
eukprot:6172859-Pleurochrysis_carterae.AAC.3